MITYIDMDGVLADFYQGAHDWEGVKVDGFPYKTGWDWPKELGSNYKDYPVEFWANLPVCEDAEKWLKSCSGKIMIATSPCSINSIIGKQIWVEKHFPKLRKSMLLIKNKWLLARDDRCLIDDNKTQIKSFLKYGGTGILVPRPWNGGV